MVGLYQEDQILAKVGVRYISITQYTKIKQFIMKKCCCTFHQFFKYCKITKELTEYCNFTSLCLCVGNCCCPKCSLDMLGWYMAFFAWSQCCRIKMLTTISKLSQKCCGLLDKQVAI